MESQDRTERLVSDRLEGDRHNAQQKADELKSEQRPIVDDDIKYFFPEWSNLDSWSYLPRGISLPHFLILSVPPVFNLEPLTAQQFLQKHRIDIETATELARKKLLLPNLYVRNSAAWRGMEHFTELLKLATVNGERVHSYFNLRNPNYESKLNERQQFFKDRFLPVIWPRIDETTQQIILHESWLERPEDMPVAVGTRWAYFDALAPSVSEKIEELFDSGDYIRAFQVHCGAKNIISDQITSALGSKVIYGHDELRVVRIARQHGVPSARTTWDEETRALERIFERAEAREAAEYFMRVITGVPYFEVLQGWHIEQLRRVIEDEEINTFKLQIYASLEAMMRLAREGGNLEPKADDFRKMVQEFQKKLNSYQRRGTTATEITGYSLGALLGAIAGGVTGGVVLGVLGWIIGGFSSLTAVQSLKESIGDAYYHWSNRDRHLVLMTVEKLKEMAEGT
jgi:hypothetical protein